MKSKLFVVGLCAGVACWNAPTATADNSKLTIEDVVAVALDSSPLVRQIESSRRLRTADAIETKRLANPTLDAELGVPTEWKEQRGDNELSVSLTQPLRLSHGSLRNRLATLVEQAGDADKEQAIVELVAKTKFSYARLWLLTKRAELLKQTQPKVRSLKEFVESGVKQGGYGRGDSAIFRAEIGKTDAEEIGIRADQAAADVELATLTSLHVGQKELIEPELPKIISESVVAEMLDKRVLTVQQRAKTLLDLANADLAVARRDAFPELRPRISYSKTNEGVDLVGVGISFDLPFYSRNSADRIRKSAESSSASALNAYVQSDAFKSTVLNAVRQYSLRREELALYENRILPAVQEALTSFEAQVRGGQGSVFQLWQTLREYLNVNKEYLELWSQIFSDYQQLSILTGQNI